MCSPYVLKKAISLCLYCFKNENSEYVRDNFQDLEGGHIHFEWKLYNLMTCSACNHPTCEGKTNNITLNFKMKLNEWLSLVSNLLISYQLHMDTLCETLFVT